MTSPGTLYIVATPIGNMADITFRAIEVLKSVDLIASEDTRTTRKLLSHYDIHTSMTSYYDATERKKTAGLIEKLTSGQSIALVSENGTPLISDPGYNLVKEAHEALIPVLAIPGPCALTAALPITGFPQERFAFEGFLSRSPQKRRKRLRELAEEERTMVFYESPHRLLKMLADMQTIFGAREVAIIREITKKFEEQVRGSSEDVIAHFTAKGVKGEFVVVVRGKSS